MSIGERIREARLAAGMSQEKLGEIIGWRQSRVGNYERGIREPRVDDLEKIARALNVSVLWLATGEGPMVADLPPHLTRVPVISYVQAGSWTEAVDSFPTGNGLETVTTDLDLGDYAFALRIKGDSMEPEFHEGDIIIIDPSVEPRPGDYVVAKRDKDNEATFKKYRRPAEDVIELVPLNPDHPPLKIDANTPGKIIGVMVEHRRYRKAGR